ncbi:MAG: phosphonate C-P lyase system protein PhnH [Alphaproteobacteria bacterium]|jgi:alpha-D-ribose 1-methylphosphonate 5-triphosphate synthase subunit PhnH|nr:phosphonate C-P lyase system protein PhnH [Rhodospirillaceae bacterium]MDG2481584.1 phosphonate C-P lyase system protein PhnH [Alphaproteobacteria bacterium]MBT6203042.1 phosphonate C-P lyase system protein PhnH [Rhodospirillaceae bacterium]MBT6510363.1 phosphonate C-P lyase system protein PhnH [Rhodospirillaceae bacterium]MBT7615549.1 phosphonate C-P lyase system protein PhnH [Rhodospirillaceae bacterium]
MNTLLQQAPAPGFADLVFDAQHSFRAVLDALARPGTVHHAGQELTAPAPLSPSATALALTLFDHDTTVWLDPSARSDATAAFLKFHCGCPLTDSIAEAGFGLIADPASMPPLASFAQGEDRYPDSSATLILELPSFESGEPVTLRGPGIETCSVITPQGLPDNFWIWMALNQAQFPLGVDIILTCGTAMIGLPRSVEAEV